MNLPSVPDSGPLIVGDLMFLNKSLGAGCLSVAFLLTFLQAPAASKPEESFVSRDGRFAFKYRNPLVRCERDAKQADRWIPAQSCQAVIPVCSDFSGSGTTVACVAYPAADAKGTNLQAAAFSVNQIKAISIDECLNITDSSVTSRRKENVNGVTFTVFATSGGAAGSLMDGEAYRSFHQNTCYELDISIASSNIGNYDPGTVREFDRQAVYRSLQSVLNTFQFVN